MSKEGKGLDLVIEMHDAGSRDKDFVRNVQRFARLGITEYFLVDVDAIRLHGHRLAPGAHTYDRLVPRAGALASEVLGLELRMEGGRLRFFSGTARVDDADELIARLERAVDEVLTSREAEAAERQAEAEARQAAEREIERLREELRKRGG